MTTVAAIAKTAFDAVSAAITDAVKSATLSDGTATYSGRVVFGGENAPAGFPMAKPESKARPVYLEGFSEVPASGWTITVGSAVHYVLSVRDIVEAGGFVVANCIAQADLVWLTADIEALTRTSNGAGGYTEAWAPISGGNDVSVGIWAMTGMERWGSERLEAVSQWRAVLPHIDGVTEACRIVADGRTFNIRFVDDVQKRGAWLVLDLAQGAAV